MPQWGRDCSPMDSDLSHMSFNSDNDSPMRPAPVPFAGCGEQRKKQHNSWSRSTDRAEIAHASSRQTSIYEQARVALDRARNVISEARSNLDHKRDALNQMFCEKDQEELMWLKSFKHELQQPYKKFKAMPRTPEIEARIGWLNAIWTRVEDLQEEPAGEGSSNAPTGTPVEKAPAPTPPAQPWEEATRAQPRMSLPVPKAGRSHQKEGRRIKEKSQSAAPDFYDPPADDQMVEDAPEDVPQEDTKPKRERTFLQLEEKKATKRKATQHEHAPSPKKKVQRPNSRGVSRAKRDYAVGEPLSCLRSDGSWNDAHVESIDEKGYVIRLHTKERLKKVLTFEEAPEYLRRQDPKPEKPRAKSMRARSQPAPAENRGKSRTRSGVRASEAPNRGKSEARPRKDKNKPKAARSAYQIYSSMMMSTLTTKVMSENPEFTRRQAHGAAATRLGVAWNKEKVEKTDILRKCMDEAAADKGRFQREMAEWKRMNNNDDSQENKDSRPRRREIHAVFDDDE